MVKFYGIFIWISLGVFVWYWGFRYCRYNAIHSSSYQNNLCRSSLWYCCHVAFIRTERCILENKLITPTTFHADFRKDKLIYYFLITVDQVIVFHCQTHLFCWTNQNREPEVKHLMLSLRLEKLLRIGRSPTNFWQKHVVCWLFVSSQL